MESNMDILAAELGMDPVEFPKNAMPATATGQTLRESVGLVECLERVQTSIEK
ncbi:MAG: hypothetical protein R2838_24065 [Caldilineaceae bacterium]